MGLIILILVGGSAGWVTTIAMHMEDRQTVLTRIAIGVVAALMIGSLTNNVSVLKGISLDSLLFSIIAAIVAQVPIQMLKNQTTL